jgi:poly(hydroxyalkanoate) granule-associated protein
MAVRKTGKFKKRTARRAAAPRQLALVDAVHQIWLAGMGALAHAQKEGPRAFEALIVDGAEFIGDQRASAEKSVRQAIETVQSAVEERMQSTRDQATETWDNLEKIFQSRVQRVLHQVGVPTADEVRALTRRVERLNANVEQLARRRAAAARPGRATRTAAHHRPAAAA